MAAAVRRTVGQARAADVDRQSTMPYTLYAAWWRLHGHACRWQHCIIDVAVYDTTLHPPSRSRASVTYGDPEVAKTIRDALAVDPEVCGLVCCVVGVRMLGLGSWRVGEDAPGGWEGGAQVCQAATGRAELEAGRTPHQEMRPFPLHCTQLRPDVASRELTVDGANLVMYVHAGEGQGWTRPQTCRGRLVSSALLQPDSWVRGPG